MFELYKKYGGEAFLKELLEVFFERVLEVKEIRHFLFNVKLERALKDIILYMPYIVKRHDRYYKGILVQTAPSGIRIGAGQFEEIANILRYTLKDFKVGTDDVPPFAGHILELIEETRAQSEDLTQTVFKPVDVSLKSLDMLLSKNGLNSKIDARGDIYVYGGVIYPFHIRLNTENKTIKYIIRAASNEGVTLEQIQTFLNQAIKSVPKIELKIIELNSVLNIISDLSLPYHMGVPTRLLVRAAKTFTEHFATVLDGDTEKYMKSLKN